jgi:hypothetical protein
MKQLLVYCGDNLKKYSIAFLCHYKSHMYMHIKSMYTNTSNTVFPQKTHAPAGFEAGPSVPQADAMATAPRHARTRGQLLLQ